MTILNWNAQDAFWSAEGLVDEIAGTEGVFNEVIEGIKSDPNGPRIDIRNVLPNFTNDIYSVSDAKAGEPEVDSRRNLLAFRLNDSAAMAKVLDKAMSNEPDAEQLEFSGTHHLEGRSPRRRFGFGRLRGLWSPRPCGYAPGATLVEQLGHRSP